VKKLISKLWQDKNCSLAVKISVFLLLLTTGCLLLVGHLLSPQVPLFYSRPWGEEQLATPQTLLLLPLGAVLVIFFNIGLAGFLLARFPFLARTLTWSAVLISFLVSITVFKVIILII
jgi:hypothetical protein